MKTGYKTLDKLLRRNGLLTGDALGTVWSKGSSIRNYLLELGYNVDSDMKFPTYDYIILGKSKSTSINLYKAYDRLNSNGMLVFVAEGVWTYIQERNYR